jgi:uncharacterized membrane protein
MRSKGRLSKSLQKSKNRAEPPLLSRLIDWICAHETAFVLLGGFVFAALILLTHAIGIATNLTIFVKVFAVVWVFGVFVCVILVTEDNSKYAKSGNTVRTSCGAIAGVGLAVMMFGLSSTAIASGLLVGAILGYLGKHWIYAL